MKTYLLLRTKATLFAFFLLLMNTALFAQTIIRHYAISEEHVIEPYCRLFSIPGEGPMPEKCAELINPLNAIGHNENDYSVLKIDYKYENSAEINQALIFSNTNTDNNTNRIVIGIGTNDGTPLSENTLKDIRLYTTAPSFGYASFFNRILKLGGPDPTRGEIEIPCTSSNPCDRVVIEKRKSNITIADLFIHGYQPVNELRVYYAYQYQNYQNRTDNILVYNKDGIFTLDKDIETTGSEVTLTGTSGKEVFRSRLNTNTFEARLPEGIYILKLQTKENKTYTSKVMVK